MSTEAKQAVKWVLISILLVLALVVLVPADLLTSWNESGRLLEDGAYDLGRATGAWLASAPIGLALMGLIAVIVVIGLPLFLIAWWQDHGPGHRA